MADMRSLVFRKNLRFHKDQEPVFYSGHFQGKILFHLQPTWALFFLLIYFYSIHSAICHPSDRPVERSRAEIQTRGGQI